MTIKHGVAKHKDTQDVIVVSGGGGTQYIQSTTAGDTTKTGTIVLGINATTAIALGLSATGGLSNIDNVGNIAGGLVSMYNTAHPDRVQAYAVVATSAPAGIIILTSGAHTIYLTDIFVSVDDLVDVQLCSETTAFAVAYLATRGGFKMEQVQPYVCSTADSFRVILSSDVNCGVSFVGYTVT